MGFAGVTVIDSKAAGVTLNCPDPEIEFEVAVTVVTPVETLVTRPEVPGVLLTVATAPVDDVQ